MIAINLIKIFHKFKQNIYVRTQFESLAQMINDLSPKRSNIMNL